MMPDRLGTPEFKPGDPVSLESLQQMADLAFAGSRADALGTGPLDPAGGYLGSVDQRPRFHARLTDYQAPYYSFVEGFWQGDTYLVRPGGYVGTLNAVDLNSVPDLKVGVTDGEIVWMRLADGPLETGAPWVFLGSGHASTILAQLTAKCYYDGSDVRIADTQCVDEETAFGLNCPPEPDCVKRYIGYSWTRVVDGLSPNAITYADGIQAGSPQCWPAYHEQNVDLPTFPGPSPAGGFPVTLATDSSAGSVSWTTPEHAGESDDVWATCTLTAGQTTRYLLATGFCFGLPGNVTISNVEVRVEAHASSATNVPDLEVKLVKGGGVVGSSQHTGADLPLTDAVRSYSHSPATWGGTPWTPLEFNNAGFGVALRYQNNDSVSRTVSIDAIEIRLTFTPAGGIGARHSIVRLRRGAGDYYLIDQLPWCDLFRRTDFTDAYGYIGYLRYWDPNAQQWRDGEEVRIQLAE